MRILSRYVAKTVVSSILLVTVVLVGIESFIQLAAELQDVGKGDYGWLQAFAFVPMMLPSDLYQLFPMAALVGSLIGLGRLATHSELVVMRAAGMSKTQVIRGVMIASVFLLVAVSLVGEGVSPFARDAALRMKSQALTQGQSLQTAQGTWVRHHNQFIHIKKIENGHELKGITRYLFDAKQHLLLASYAKKATRTDGKWVFYDVQQSLFVPNKVTQQSYKQQAWPLKLHAEDLLLSKVDPNQQSLVKLSRYISFKKHSGLGVGIDGFVFWKRLFQPLATLVMILLAIPVVFGPLRSVSMGLRILAGVLIGFGFYILNQFLGPFSLVYQVPEFVAAALPTILFALLSGFLLIYRV